jgi:hypothetical protein
MDRGHAGARACRALPPCARAQPWTRVGRARGREALRPRGAESARQNKTPGSRSLRRHSRAGGALCRGRGDTPCPRCATIDTAAWLSACWCADVARCVHYRRLLKSVSAESWPHAGTDSAAVGCGRCVASMCAVAAHAGFCTCSCMFLHMRFSGLCLRTDARC